jgi:menaquinone-9 beta-reductase
MEQCEVLIVGAGPAGSTCARILAKWGISVLLLDRDQFPRDKPCAGRITPAVLEALRIDPQVYRQGRLLQEIRQFRTGLLFGSKERVIDYGATVSYGIRRREFDDFLLAQNTSPTTLGQAACSLERTADGWLVNGDISARLLVGAGGHNCPVAYALGARPGHGEPAIIAMMAEFQMNEEQLATCPLSPGHAALRFNGDRSGYAWLLRKGPFLNLGLGSLGGDGLRRRLGRFCEQLQHRGELTVDCGAFTGHAYLPYRSEGGRRIVGDRTMLIGDAAGLACPVSGGGIQAAVESAIMAAQTILCALGDYRPQWLEPYAVAVAERFGGNREGSAGLRLPPVLRELGTRMVLSSGWLTRRLVLDRWFLHRDQRPLVPKLES